MKTENRKQIITITTSLSGLLVGIGIAASLNFSGGELDSFSIPLVEQPAKDLVEPFEVSLREKAGSYTLNIKNRTEKRVVSRYGIEILDDRGNSMIEPIISSDQQLPGKSENQKIFRADVDLADGYYIVRAKVVSLDAAGAENSAFAETYLEIIDAKKNSISRKEFHKNSLHNVAIITGGK